MLPEPVGVLITFNKYKEINERLYLDDKFTACSIICSSLHNVSEFRNILFLWKYNNNSVIENISSTFTFSWGLKLYSRHYSQNSFLLLMEEHMRAQKNSLITYLLLCISYFGLSSHMKCQIR
jgi:hypothetical protein